MPLLDEIPDEMSVWNIGGCFEVFCASRLVEKPVLKEFDASILRSFFKNPGTVDVEVLG